ncbi:MAG: sigma-70 family RNA polymerase sigma factor [Pyrinomonadaceae bacterium]|nr:sigma-70 family RNA polymerase sigma factor [Pyrinomonadaceae bacterium]
MKPEPEQAAQSDAELLRAIAQGDEAALAQIYDRYAPTLFGMMLRILHSRAEAEDVLQEVFLQVWQHASQFDEERGRPFTWLATIAHSRAIDRLRSLDSRQRAATRAAVEHAEEQGDAVDDVFRMERTEVVRRALNEIPEGQKQVLLLAYFEGLTQSEIAERTKEPLGTVKTRMRSGLIKLRELMRENLRNWR